MIPAAGPGLVLLRHDIIVGRESTEKTGGQGELLLGHVILPELRDSTNSRLQIQHYHFLVLVRSCLTVV